MGSRNRFESSLPSNGEFAISNYFFATNSSSANGIDYNELEATLMTAEANDTGGVWCHKGTSHKSQKMAMSNSKGSPDPPIYQVGPSAQLVQSLGHKTKST